MYKNDDKHHIKQSMRLTLLKAPLIISNFVVGEELCSYEDYLRELINQSEWFKSNHPGIFLKPQSEHCRQCDAVSENYEIDFKLFTSKTSLQARSVLSLQISKLSEGVVAFSKSKDKGIIKATLIHAVLKNKTLSDLESIRKSQIRKYGIENDIISVLKTLETNKNILLFFPYIISFEDHQEFEKAIRLITEFFTEHFQSAFEYRYKNVENFDTFLCCIYDDRFIIFIIKETTVIMCDSVSSSLMPTYCKLNGYLE